MNIYIILAFIQNAFNVYKKIHLNIHTCLYTYLIQTYSDNDLIHFCHDDDDDDVYLNKLQTKGVKKSILYMYNVDQPIRHK
jgi:hypothetical protein